MRKHAAKIFTMTFLLLVVCVGALIFAYRDTKNNSNSSDSAPANNEANDSSADPEENNYVNDLAKYLSEKGAVMYGYSEGSETARQKEILGNAFQYIDYVECDSNTEDSNVDECNANSISVYPTWIYDAKQYSGVQTLANLAGMVSFNSSSAE